MDQIEISYRNKKFLIDLSLLPISLLKLKISNRIEVPINDFSEKDFENYLKFLGKQNIEEDNEIRNQILKIVEIYGFKGNYEIFQKKESVVSPHKKNKTKQDIKGNTIFGTTLDSNSQIEQKLDEIKYVLSIQTNNKNDIHPIHGYCRIGYFEGVKKELLNGVDINILNYISFLFMK